MGGCRRGCGRIEGRGLGLGGVEGGEGGVERRVRSLGCACWKEVQNVRGLGGMDE